MSQPFFSAETSRGSLPSARSAAMTASIASVLDLGAGDRVFGEAVERLAALRPALRASSRPAGITSAAPFSTGGSAVICRSRSSSACRLCSRSTRRCGRRLGILGVDALLLAGALLLAQPRGARVPIVDLARQPGAHLALDLVDLGEPAASSLRPDAAGTRLAMA